jgi:hypothetical protein
MHRPEPVHCVRAADGVQACTDGVGVSWTCQVATGWIDADCVAVSQVPIEAR